jgi:hypothetical protein
MQTLRYWPFGKVLLACVAWFVLTVIVMVGWIVFQARGLFLSSSGAGGIGAVSVGINAVMLAIPFIPPVVLIVAWLVARRTTPI